MCGGLRRIVQCPGQRTTGEIRPAKWHIGQAVSACALPSRGAIIIYERLIDDERRVNAAALLASPAMVVATTGGSNFSGAYRLRWVSDASFRDIRLGPLTSEISMVTGLK
jgi:hypothetical protein